MEEARIISVCSQKGGSGKSAITSWVANSFKREGKRVLVIDADGQRTIAKIRQREIDQGIASDGACDVLAADNVLAVLEEKFDDYDIIFIDLPRMTGADEAVLALTYCDSILVPIRLGDSDVISAFEFINAAKKMGEVRRERGLDFSLFGIQNFRQPNLRENRQIDDYAEMLGVTLFNNPLPHRADFMRIGTINVPSDFASVADAFNPFYYEFKERFQLN